MIRRPSRILVVDDDGDILDLLKYNLEKEGFIVKTLDKNHRTVKVAKKFLPDLIILDLMMPFPDGTELCKSLRSLAEFQNTYIFFLTARSGCGFGDDVLAIGGDDYIEKIMGLRGLIHKVNAVLKEAFIIRKRIPELTSGGLTLQRAAHIVTYNHKRIQLSLQEFELLFFFMQNAERLVTVQSIIRNIWGSEIFQFESAVELYIQNIRKKIAPEIVECCGQKGYRFAWRLR
jgi:two-component system, OmpR family, alkaline phosphatase synthesis response regulator PhoP